MIIRSCRGSTPRFDPTVRAAETAVAIGNVTLGREVSLWHGAVLRGDQDAVTIGDRTNIQENAVLHLDAGEPLTIGKDVTVGHGAIVHGCTVEDGALIGMGAILLNGCVIGAGSLVAAGALVTQNKVIPPGSMVMGSPARVVRSLTPEEIDGNLHSAAHYAELAAEELDLIAPEKGAQS